MFFSSVIDGMVGNFHELHQLQELVEHLLRSSQKKVEWSQYLVEWSGVCWGVWVFFLRGCLGELHSIKFGSTPRKNT